MPWETIKGLAISGTMMVFCYIMYSCNVDDLFEELTDENFPKKKKVLLLSIRVLFFIGIFVLFLIAALKFSVDFAMWKRGMV